MRTVGLAVLSLLLVASSSSNAQASRWSAGSNTGRSVPNAELSGYTVITAGPFDDPAGTQSGQSATCPPGTVVLGGGSQSSSTSLAVNLNSSWPSSTMSWSVKENNGSAGDASFTVYAICARKPKFYAIVATSVTALPGQLQPVSCPTKTQPSDGGVQWQSTDLLDNLDSTFPQRPRPHSAKEWVVILDAGSGSMQPATAYAVCGRIPGWELQNGPARGSSAGTQTDGTAVCPSATVPVGGGSNSDFVHVAGVDDQSEYPQSGSWQAVQNNSSATMNVLAPTAVCAK
ncbi:MAG TPA: hypothetical protein VK277_13690 [Acidimicrobiales bacterium]|nr:hypothetical protein [Acidimicrobiales bacterium]